MPLPSQANEPGSGTADAHRLLTELESQAERGEVTAAVLGTQAVRAGNYQIALD